MTKTLFTSALFAGLAAGLIAALLQFWLVTPLLLEGEAYETGELTHFSGVSEAQVNGHGHGETDAGDGVVSEGNFARHAMTVGVNLIVFTGYGLLMVAGFALAAKFGHGVTLHRGMVWGLAGFIALQLAPAAGLFPELPGTPAQAIELRQYWWLGTAVATVIGIALIAFGRGIVPSVLGVAALAVPHVIGAPHLDFYGGTAPPELSALFVSRTLFVALATWVVLGGVAGYFWDSQTRAT